LFSRAFAAAHTGGIDLASNATTLNPATSTQRLVWHARALVVLGLGWHVLESAVTLAAGIPSSSVSLVSFGADVAVETFGGLVLLWRFSATRTLTRRAESSAKRLIGLSYFLLSGYIALDSTRALFTDERPDPSFLGIAIAVLALIVMPQLCRAKCRLGDRLGSSAVKREGLENMMCAYLSVSLLLGLGLNALLGWWWADPVSAYAVAAIALLSGRRAWNGVECCAVPPGTGLLLVRDDCDCDGSSRCCRPALQDQTMSNPMTSEVSER
jgi:divalent metal cation (Fe/Co/Zn/Cd) transporter